MILPILLIWLLDGKKSSHSITAANQQQSLMGKLGNFLDEIACRWVNSPLTATTTVKIESLQKIRQLNSNCTGNANDKYSYVLACNPQKNQQWFQKMSPAEKQELLEQLKSDYRQILLNYFLPEKTLKPIIDKFINALFYANIPVPQIIEIHMELIEEFSKQLKLEGRSDETLLDYRLTLIDILAHLCEVYRVSSSKIN